MTTIAGKPKVRYRFADFVVSPARRALLRSGQEIPLIPRYFELLVLLLERRHEAVQRRDILETVWSDVVVSDGALSQAIRTLRRTLGDDSRNPSYIRTVSRHGYRFVFPGVIEEAEEAADWPSPSVGPEAAAPRSAPTAPHATHAAPQASPSSGDPFETALSRLLAGAGAAGEEGDERRDAAETLHSLGTAEALRRLGERTGHEEARALLRDTRWEVAGAGPVPLLGQPGGLRAVRALVRMRLRKAARLAGSRWAAASGGGAAAGLVAGLAGGLVLRACPDADTPLPAVVAIALVAAVIGGVGAAGVGAGLAAAEALARSLRGPVLVFFGAIGGGTIGALAHLLGSWTVEGVFGRDLSPVGGGFEGLLIGAAAGLGYALSTPRPAGGGMATPRGWKRALVAGVTGLCCAGAGMGLTWMGSNLGGVSLDYMARAFQGSHVGLSPLAHVLGERELGPVTRTILGAYEGLLFGAGLAFGITRRPR